MKTHFHRKRDRRSYLGLYLLVPLLLTAVDCGSNSVDDPPAVEFGTLFIQVQNTPLDNVMSFKITLDKVELNPDARSVLNGSTEVDLVGLQLSAHLVRRIGLIEADNFTSVTLTFSDPSIKICPGNPPDCTTSQEILPTLVNTTVTQDVSLPLAPDSPQLLLIDFDLPASLVTDGSGIITGVDPVVTLSTRDIPTEVDEVEEIGRVSNILRTSDTERIFNFEPFASCEEFTITVDGNTIFEDYDDLAFLANTFENFLAGQFIRVVGDIEAYQDENGHTRDRIRATIIEVDQLVESADRLLKGPILKITQDPNTGENTGFDMFLQKVHPCSSPPLADDVVTVTIIATGNPPTDTTFRLDEEVFMADPMLFDGPEDLKVGQTVAVDPDEHTTSTVDAEDITLEDQIIGGTVNGTPVPPNFMLTPAFDIFSNTSITVETGIGTVFQGITGAGDLVDAQYVVVRGLLLLDAGQLRFLAQKVEGLP